MGFARSHWRAKSSKLRTCCSHGMGHAVLRHRDVMHDQMQMVFPDDRSWAHHLGSRCQQGQQPLSAGPRLRSPRSCQRTDMDHHRAISLAPSSRRDAQPAERIRAAAIPPDSPAGRRAAHAAGPRNGAARRRARRAPKTDRRRPAGADSGTAWCRRMTGTPKRPNKVSSRVGARPAASPRRIPSCQPLSASARMPCSSAGPATAHGPNCASSHSTVSASATAKPSRSPARPKNLPNERSTTMPP